VEQQAFAVLDELHRRFVEQCVQSIAFTGEHGRKLAEKFASSPVAM